MSESAILPPSYSFAADWTRCEEVITLRQHGPFILDPLPASPTDLALLIRAEVLTCLRVPIEAILRRDRRPRVVAARQAIALRLRTECRLTLKEIGPLIGLRDHTSVRHLIRKGGGE